MTKWHGEVSSLQVMGLQTGMPTPMSRLAQVTVTFPGLHC
jgi:hypothetical protein